MKVKGDHVEVEVEVEVEVRVRVESRSRSSTTGTRLPICTMYFYVHTVVYTSGTIYTASRKVTLRMRLILGGTMFIRLRS